METLTHLSPAIHEFLQDYERLKTQVAHLSYEVKVLKDPDFNKIPMEGMPWNIPGGIHSPEAVPASEYVDREMIHQMTCREDLLTSD